jgi:uncharacterized repeat protein (TIGR01451 family)
VRKVILAAVVFLSSSIAFGDISLTDRATTLRFLTAETLTPRATDADRLAAQKAANQAKRDAKRNHTGKFSNLTPVPSSNAARHAAAVAANQAKRDAKHNRTGKFGALHPTTQSLHPRTLATGSVGLIDSSGLKYFINTNITFSTTSSASGAASEASFTHAIVASTSGGGTTSSTLNDAYDGYQTICVSLTNATTQCQTGNANFSIYNQNGPASVDAGVPAGPNCTNRQYVFVAQTIGGLSVQRRVYVPPNDNYIRWLNSYTNTTGAPITFTTMTSNNLGSDSNTRIVTTSSGDNVATVADNWVTSFQQYSGNTSSDPRLVHVMWGPGAATPISNISFVDGDDNPFWVYSITLAPGQTKNIMNFSSGLGSKAAANAKAAALTLLPATATQCLTATQLGQIVNFVTATDLSIVKSTGASTAFGGNPITYTLAVTNNGPSPAASVSVVDVLPAGSAFVSASGVGWTCNNVAGTVTCTLPNLNVGAATPISLTMNAPNPPPATLSNTATVSSSTSDTNPANNSSTSVVPLLPGSQIPALSGWMLCVLAAMLGLIAIARRT